MSTSPSRWVPALRENPVLSGVPEEQLQWLAGKLEYLQLQEGAYLFEKGAPLDRMVIILKGKISFIQEQKGSSRVIQEIESGAITGALPYSRASHANAAARASEASELLMLKKEFFREMILEHQQLVEVLVHIMTSRVREFTKSQQQSSKMEALGRLSAGLTHELNNPAAAVARSAEVLKEQLQEMPAILEELLRGESISTAFREVQQLLSSLNNKQAARLSLMEKTSLGDSWEEWLKKRDIDQARTLAESFADYPVRPEQLPSFFQEEQNKEKLQALLQWLKYMLSLQKLSQNIQHSSARISQLVNAVKAYSHMDRSTEKETTDIREGILNTLTLLNFKLKKKNIKVEEAIAEDLPEACVYAGELNQLWTNLIDNAIDAMPEGGKLRISAAQENSSLKIEIEDNGEGIPEEVQEQIFDPFFTTKQVGEGSGLGLDIAKRIVDHHEGKLTLDSKPGATRFTVYLPL
ncbi:ATP-binding protein [Nafulsella turpanensis]|uniref:ATP-binding protein n=1 Tax=Nafulsella turpanensis TaxID=1265690 RepID=UPI0003481DA7|nr:ATP-binding protein [Nafulsella turpanensis]